MKKAIIVIAIILVNMNFTSCTAERLDDAQENSIVKKNLEAILQKIK